MKAEKLFHLLKQIYPGLTRIWCVGSWVILVYKNHKGELSSGTIPGVEPIEWPDRKKSYTEVKT